jgi:hypothetical protein
MIIFFTDDPNVQLKQGTVGAVVTDEDDCLDTLLENVEYPDSVFHNVFSDPSSSESSDDEEAENDDDERDYSIGIGKYLEKIKSGKFSLHKRLIACLSYQKITTFPLPYVIKKSSRIQLLSFLEHKRNMF